MSDHYSHYIKPEQAVTLHGLFLERVQRSPDHVAYRYFDTQKNDWVDLSWRQMRERVALWQGALQQEGLAPGDRVAIMLRNCPEWVMFEQAALSLGLVVVPLYVIDRAENIAYIMQDAGVKVLLFETAEQWRGLSQVAHQLDCVQRFVSLQDCASSATPDPRLQRVQDWLPDQAGELQRHEADGKALATIMYTSGTTGKPKGVMLSHQNILLNAYAGLLTFPLAQQDVMLSFLPLSHAFERTGCYYIAMTGGATVAYARSIAHLAEDLKIVRPTVLMAVPRIYERMYDAIQGKLEQARPLQRALFNLAVNVGWQRFEYQQGRRGWHLQFLLWPILKALVADKVMSRLGGRLRLSVSGGAALPPRVSRLFIAFGLPLIQGYGMTETSPVISVNRLGHNRPETVGHVLRDIQVRVGDQGALLVKGPCNMLGYWNNAEATAAMMDADGWINTGDIARIDADGCITLTGRLKEIIVMSNGEKVSPTDMESAILSDRLFDQVMVYGEGKPALVALVVVNQELWEQFADEQGVRADLVESLRDTRIERQVLQRIGSLIKDFPGYAKIRRVLLLNEPWTIESGLLTPTLKLKRQVVVDRYRDEIEQLYTLR